MEGENPRWYEISKLSNIVPQLLCNTGLVEQVKDGTTLRVRLFMPEGDHQMVNITLAGVKSPRASTRQGESSEPLGEEVGLNGHTCACLLTFFFNLERQNSSRSPVCCNGM